ncbi:MAG: hypothetical protein J6R24_02840 [Clostridia bacterium]|nr:hypothetical protein [Clostridia bacterium]
MTTPFKPIKRRNQENAQATLNRATRVISTDKSPMSEDCQAVALADFTHIAREYFDLKAPPKLEISNQDGAYAVTFTFTADRVKSFYLLK